MVNKTRLISILLVTSAVTLWTSSAWAFTDPGQVPPARVRKSASLPNANAEFTNYIKMANRARRLIVLNRELNTVERLLKEANQGLPPGLPFVAGNLASLLETQGRHEEAREVFRTVVWPSEGQGWDENSPRHLLRYALLCRSVGAKAEEQATLERIPGETPQAKVAAAIATAREEGGYEDRILFLVEMNRLDPQTKWETELASARKDWKLLLEAERKRALEIESGITP